MWKIWKNGRFSGRLQPDWGNTTRAATAGLGSIGLISSRTRDSVDPISSVSHVILTQVSTRVFAYKISCHRYIRKMKTVGGLNPAPLTLYAVVLPLSY